MRRAHYGSAGVFLLLVTSVPAGIAGTGGQNEPAAPPLATVSGRVTVLDKGNRLADDAAHAVVWLATVGPAAAAAEPPAGQPVRIVMADKEFRPHQVIARVGIPVAFPNTDPFNHNVFSRSENGPFDLGRYGRGAEGSTIFGRPGVARVYCNVHARMSAVVIVLDNPYHAQPSSDGRFGIDRVPPGEYVLHAWHERTKEFAPRPVTITAAGLADVRVELDAREYEFVQHLNKYGQPYSQARRGRRY